MNHTLFRAVYTFIFICVLPFVFVRLWWRGVRVPGYRQRWMQRFGFFPATSTTASTIWLHAVSVGEVQAAAPLISALLKQYKSMSVVVTTTTPTGYDQAVQLFGNRITVGHLPYDIPWMIHHFLRRIRPTIGIIMERELWPNLFYICRRQGVPLLMANARLPEKSLKKYTKGSRLTRGIIQMMLKSIHGIAAVSSEDAGRFQSMGVAADKIRVTGNLKANALPPLTYRAADLDWVKSLLKNKQPLWVAASTHAGEESVMLEAHKEILKTHVNSLLILVPRHPERTREIVQQCEQIGLVTCRHSLGQTVADKTQVYLVDTLGDLMLFYQCAEIAFVGGSLVPVGGHNVLEPIICEKPVVFGPHVWNFDDICRSLLDGGGGLQVQGALELAQCVQSLFENKKEQKTLITQSRRILDKHCQSLTIHMEMVAKILQKALPDSFKA